MTITAQVCRECFRETFGIAHILWIEIRLATTVLQWLAIDGQAFIFISDFITWQGHYALNVIYRLITWVAKHNNITTLPGRLVLAQ